VSYCLFKSIWLICLLIATDETVVAQQTAESVVVDVMQLHDPQPVSGLYTHEIVRV
jgi:hypothetical protein